VTKFPKSFLLSSFASLKTSTDKDKVCLGYLEDKSNGAWECSSSDEFRIQSTSGKYLYYIQNRIDHFTSVNKTPFLSASLSSVS